MPDAPPPVYSDHGRMLGDWSVRIGSDLKANDLVVTVDRTSTPHVRGMHREFRCDLDDLEEAIAEASRLIRSLGARSLF